MSKANYIQNLIVGSAFLGGLALLGGMTLIVKGSNLSNAGVFTARFEHVDNLRNGEGVYLRGTVVGEVTGIQYDPDTKKVLVQSSVDNRVALTDKTKFVIRSLGPLGGKYLEIVPPISGGKTQPFDWDEFVGESERGLFGQIEELAKDVGGTGEANGLIPRLIRDEQLAEDIVKTVQELRGSVETFNKELAEGKGLLPRILRDEGTGQQFSEIVEAIRNVFVEDDGLLTDVRSIAKDLRTTMSDIRSQKGIAGMLISDEKAKGDMLKTFEDLRASVEKLSNGEGLAGRLISDKELGTRFDRIAENIDDITSKINSGDGVVAGLINDKDAWDEMRRILVLARESIEDLREQAPISTSANVLFAVF
ncbi:MAG: MlaD family protein [Planctomycetota bacterium]